jgi:benzoyl-CoA reductase/2-hydroxyglutaryl-CoA dehydratase subunit BcrC/BadD/HgdB
MLRALGRVKDLVTNSNPLTISPAHENIWMCLTSLSLNITEIAEAAEALNQLYGELKERTSKGVGVVEKDAPRVLATLPMGQTDPRLEHLASELGLAIVANDVIFSDPLPKNSKDPFYDIVLVFQHGMMSMPVGRRISMLIEGCKRLKIDGVLDRYHVGCRSVAADALLIEKAVKKELGIPVMTLEWENFDPRVFRPEEYKRQLEGFKAMMLSSAARKRASSDSI